MRSFGKATVRGAVFGVLLFASACAKPELTGDIYDPYEQQNRLTHEFNKKVDRAVLRPAAEAYGEKTPEPLRIAVSNVAGNLALPGSVLNDLLQFKVEDAVHNTARFVINTVFGLGGVIDLGSNAGLPPRYTDFGETMYVWGVGEGPYVELPFLGPSTERDAVGKIVDVVINPLNQVVPAPQKYALPAFSLVSKVGDRYQFATTVDSVLYESADSYAQSRLLYLDSRRFQLGIQPGGQEDASGDLYEDILSQ